MESQALLIFFNVLLFSSTLLKFSIAGDTLGPNQSLADGETLVSTSQRFEFGFFSPGSSKNRYLGIWYVKTPATVVWVANRNNPITDSQGILNISGDGSLVLVNGKQNLVWSSNPSQVPTDEPFLQLLDSGNLVLSRKTKMGSDNYLWQSFDYPCDTRLPGMKLVWNSNTSLGKQLTSWRASDDPSPGDYTLRIDNHGLPQLVMNLGSTKEYRSGPWNGLRFSGYPRAHDPAFEPILEFKEDLLISLSERNSSFISRAIQTQSGFLQHYILNEKSSTWDLMHTAPNDLCDNYEHCGPNGICRINRATICECLKGFTPKFPQEWEASNWSNGCVRSVPLDCKDGEGFVKVAQVKLPDLLEFRLNTSMSLKECEQECLKTCSCIAYASSNISDGSGCSMWFGDLIDTREFLQGDSQQDFYIRLAASVMESTKISNTKKKRLLKILLLPVTSGMLTLISICGCVLMKMKITRRGLEVKKENLELPLFDLTIIADATSNFSRKHMIGEGGFGPVYKGRLSTEQEIAVKRLSKNSGQGLEEFKNEVASIAKLQHRNLVRLLGCCIQGEERMLIYDGYMSPEYAIDGKFSVKSDVFSLGVLLLEIVSGKRNRGFHHPDHHHTLLGHAWLRWNEGRSMELMDTCLKDSCVESQVQRCMQVGLLCVQKLPEDRPAMSSVVFMLGNEGAVLPQPKQPGFFIERSFVDNTTIPTSDKFYTDDEATITILEAR
ncbi:G-type lectin S-receptor-like serine/threonine-protein kinase [Actinidia chinensis var. chinensis]|uniref:Receptor-like serine/threonine-protein kinase n=1 Tax=Actinidia chinensis var. chinensis TaxID=1590841 RepID=A0A2R6PTF3_ACTCC|nr:G-type lectin S-receptor-like serine/threonine-protein kinase [Actinidia chinensis var. chinensis]